MNRLIFAIGVSSVLLIGALLAGCATADPPAQISKNGCTVDPKKVCQYLVDQPGFTIDQGSTGQHGWTLNNSPMQHVVVHIPFRGSGALLRCKFDTADTHAPRAIEANFEPGPIPDESNLERLREKGLCQ
jgi:hypothetical protein